MVGITEEMYEKHSESGTPAELRKCQPGRTTVITALPAFRCSHEILGVGVGVGDSPLT